MRSWRSTTGILHMEVLMARTSKMTGRQGVLARALCFSGLALWLAGCAAVLVGAGAGGATYAYVTGQLEQGYSASLDRTYAATLTALKRLEITVIERNKDQLGATIQARRADDTKVKVKLEAEGRDHTRVAIRVGIFGDKDVSIRINEEIRRALGR